MTDAIEAHILYQEDVTDGSKLSIFESLLSKEEFECSKSLDELRELLGEESGWKSVNFIYGDIHPRIELDRTVDGLPDLPLITLHIEQKEFRERHYTEEEIARHVEDLVALVTDLYESSVEQGHPPQYVIAGNPTETEHLRTDHDRVRTTPEGLESGEVEEMYWLQIWPPKLADSLGRDTIEDAPAWRVNELSGGAILLVAYQNPVFVGDDYFDLLDRLSLSR